MLDRSGWLRKSVPALLLVALAGTACGGGGDSASGGDGSGSATGKQLSGTLEASGSSFQQPFQEACIEAYDEAQPDVTVNYGGGGSGKGKQDLADGVVDFAGTDSLVKPEDMSKYADGVVYIPVASAPITVSYNLSGVEKLKLSAETIAKIFTTEITSWDDAAIKADNAGAKLPSKKITVVHRSDSSGTTENFTKFLAAAAPSAWTLKPGSTVEWPANTQAGNGNSGVASTVKSTDGAIGYVDLSDAKASGLSFAAVKNKAGAFVEPTTEAASVAVDNATVGDDLSYDPIFTDGDKAYPITSPTWVLLPQKPAKVDLVKSYVSFMVNDCQDLAEEIDYAPLPDSLRTKAEAAVDKL